MNTWTAIALVFVGGMDLERLAHIFLVCPANFAAALGQLEKLLALVALAVKALDDNNWNFTENFNPAWRCGQVEFRRKPDAEHFVLSLPSEPLDTWLQNMC